MADWVRHEPVAEKVDYAEGGRRSDSWRTRWSRQLEPGATATVTRTFLALAKLDISVGEHVGPGHHMLEATEYEVGNQRIALLDRYIRGYEPTSQGAHAAAMSAEYPTDTEWDTVAPDRWSTDARRRERAADNCDGWG